MDDTAIGGITLQVLAEGWNEYGVLQTKFGERQVNQEFEKYAASKGYTAHDFWQSWNDWHKRFEADPTGKLQARFHTITAELSNKAHFGDVRDMSADKHEGVTLDQYALLTLLMTKPGIDADEVARAHGLSDAAHWLRANTAWANAMAQDTTMALAVQFGQLCQKHGGAAYTQSMEDQTAALLAHHNNSADDDIDEPQEELDRSIPTLLKKLKSNSRSERFEAARWLSHQFDEDDDDEKKAACLQAVPVLIDAIERCSDDTTNRVEGAARALIDLGQRSDDIRHAIQVCVNRAKEELAGTERAFASIRDKAVPERVPLQTKIQNYTSMIETLESILEEEEWEDD